MLVKYRKAKKSDLQELVKIAKKRESWLRTEDIEVPLASFPECCFVMEVEGKTSGAILFSKIRESVAFACLWFVDPKYKNQGFGKELERVASAYLAEQGIRRIISFLGEEHKKTIKACTEELGWKLIGKVGKEVWIYKDLKK